MNLSDQVTSLELSKCLHELGVKQNSLFWYIEWHGPNGSIKRNATNRRNNLLISLFYESITRHGKRDPHDEPTDPHDVY